MKSSYLFFLCAAVTWALEDETLRPCELLHHPEYNCGDSFECEPDWPSNTGNFNEDSDGGLELISAVKLPSALTILPGGGIVRVSYPCISS